LYLQLSYVLSLLNIALRISKLLSCPIDKVSDIGTLFNISIHCLSTDMSIRDCLHLALGLNGHSCQVIFGVILSLEETLVQAYSLS